MQVSLEELCPAESAVRLRNPERGFYALAAFLVADDMEDPRALVDRVYVPDGDDLVLVEVNIAAYAQGPITARGLAHIDALFGALVARGYSLMVRFLYDWDGRAKLSEPTDLDVVCTHVEQIGETMRPFEGRILCYQGLLVGNWGEMHGSRFDGADLAVVHAAMRRALGEQVFLSVRTPAIWRALASAPVPARRMAGMRLGLFNDGMFGSVSDLGTYRGGQGESEADARERELGFQDRLCRFAPNGGEAVGSSPLSDFERAMADMQRMHVSYLNRTHDPAVLDKWAGSRVRQVGPWHGTDGLSYVEGHLGYRFSITRVTLRHGGFHGRLTRTLGVQVEIGNSGFAPLYHRATPWVRLRQGDHVETVCMEGDVEPGDLGPHLARTSLPLSLFGTGTCELYLSLVSEKYGRQIALAHDGAHELGYLVGRVFVS